MKANEAPEKIYIQPSAIEQLPYQNIVYTKPLADNSIRYTRTDAFIEKAVVWISNNCYIPHSTLENFRKYIEGE